MEKIKQFHSSNKKSSKYVGKNQKAEQTDVQCRCRNCSTGCVRQRQIQKKIITEQESRDKWERSLSNDAACLNLTVSVYVGSLNVVFLPGGNGQRESVSWLGQGWEWLSKEWSVSGGTQQRREVWAWERHRSLKKLSKTHKDKEEKWKHYIQGSSISFIIYAVLQKQRCLWLKWLWQSCLRRSTDIATRQSRRNLEDRVKDNKT